MSLRDYARGKTCMVRAVGICNCNTETTVLAHLRIADVSGMGLKSPDIFGAWACSACHDYVDGRLPTIDSYEKRRLALLEGVIRTQYELVVLGLLTEATVTHE